MAVTKEAPDDTVKTAIKMVFPVG